MVDQLYTSDDIGLDDVDVEKSWFSMMKLDNSAFIELKDAASLLYKQLGVVNSHQLGKLPRIFTDVLRSVNRTLSTDDHTARHMVDSIYISGKKHLYVELRESVQRSDLWDITITFPLDSVFSVLGTSHDAKIWRFDAQPGSGLLLRCRRKNKRLPLLWNESYPTPVTDIFTKY